MIDYPAWLTRAEQFVRQLNYLPGEWGISVSVEPPLSKAEADDLDRSLPFGLPTPLREFYTRASSGCFCTYEWQPAGKSLRKLEKALSGENEVNGGLELIPAAELKEAHSVHEWVDIWTEDMKEELPEAIEVWRSTVPSIAIGNGDYLGLHVTSDGEEFPVVYLCHDDSEYPVTEISPSFDTFLADWETIYYLGPEIWLLEEFLDNDGEGPLNVKRSRTRAWRKLIGKGGRK